MGTKKQRDLTEIERQEQEAELFTDLDAHWDEKSFVQLGRSDPITAQIAGLMVDARISPDKIVSHLLHKYPHLWPQTQALKASIRHLEQIRDE